ncbi:hypothetical protein CHY_1907 [Carboxydothermus hydrogenoformans Z-2901]|uniref:Uncharacterized protein n=1 Tax=Carboxydothermus hydrogenoformans (strain ATCC BAA-161 / DSM 6008 / Z-2901) TaxID=246194 RepID=Q3AAV8_CARHZ|nr:hypothetical protein CHY_1907 [Carboxydothermus hydrogenoformans Z-2901]
MDIMSNLFLYSFKSKKENKKTLIYLKALRTKKLQPKKHSKVVEKCWTVSTIKINNFRLQLFFGT